MKRDSTELRRRLAGRWLDALAHLSPALSEAVQRPGRNVTSPVDGKPDGFRLFRDAAETGGGCIQNERAFPEGIDLLMRIEGWSFPDTYDRLLEWLEGPKPLPPVRRIFPVSPEKKQAQMARRRRWLNDSWSNAVSLDHDAATPARVYLRSRGVCDAALHSSNLRCHPALKYQDAEGGSGTFPSLIGLVRDNEGIPVSLHRTFLTSSGTKLVVGGKSVRKLTPSVSDSKGRVLQLRAPRDGVLGIAEGLETSLAVTTTTGIPVWSCISASMMPVWRPPEGIHTVFIFADRDRSSAGQNAGYALRDELKTMGIKGVVMLPKLELGDRKSVDWADVLRRDPNGFDLVRTAFELYRSKD